jgi:hypothetical protein
MLRPFRPRPRLASLLSATVAAALGGVALQALGETDIDAQWARLQWAAVAGLSLHGQALARATLAAVLATVTVSALAASVHVIGRLMTVLHLRRLWHFVATALIVAALCAAGWQEVLAAAPPGGGVGHMPRGFDAAFAAFLVPALPAAITWWLFGAPPAPARRAGYRT